MKKPLPHAAGAKMKTRQLEPKDRSELNPSRATTTKEWVADADVAGRTDGIRPSADLLIIALGGKA